MKTLRNPLEGCPWDKKQTIHSIAHYTHEEVYEVLDCIENNDMDGLCDELGDLLFHIVFYAEMANEAGHFDFERIAKSASDKLRRRHPHIFGETQNKSVDEVRTSWEAIKHEERQDKARKIGKRIGLLDDISIATPAMMRAEKLQKRASTVGFDWPEINLVFAKLEEELSELREALETKASMEHISEEIGDLLFSCVNLARHVNVDSESALRFCNRKFESRFRHIENQLALQGLTMKEATLEQMEALWIQAKTILRLNK